MAPAALFGHRGELAAEFSKLLGKRGVASRADSHPAEEFLFFLDGYLENVVPAEEQALRVFPFPLEPGEIPVESRLETAEILAFGLDGLWVVQLPDLGDQLVGRDGRGRFDGGIVGQPSAQGIEKPRLECARSGRKVPKDRVDAGGGDEQWHGRVREEKGCALQHGWISLYNDAPVKTNTVYSRGYGKGGS